MLASLRLYAYGAMALLLAWGGVTLYRAGYNKAHGELLAYQLAQQQSQAAAVAQAITEANQAAERQRQAAQTTITQLEADREAQNERIKRLAVFHPAACGGRVVIDDEWLRHLNATLARSSGQDAPSTGAAVSLPH